MANGGYDGSVKLGVSLEAESSNIVKNITTAVDRAISEVSKKTGNTDLFKGIREDAIKNITDVQHALSSSRGKDIGGFSAIATALHDAGDVFKYVSSGKDADVASTDAEIQRYQALIAVLKEAKAQYSQMLAAKGTQNAQNTPQAPKLTVDNKELDEASRKVDTLKAKLRELESAGGGAQHVEWRQLTAELGEAEKEYQKLYNAQMGVAESGKHAGISVSQGISMASRAANGISNAFNKVNSTLKSCIVKVGQFAASLGKLVVPARKSTKELTTGLRRGLKYLLMMVFGVRGLMFAFRKLRTVLIETLGEMAKASSEFNEQISETKTLLNTLKGTLGTAIQPLVSAWLPAINAVIQALTQALLIAAKFFAVLSGQNYILKATGAQEDYAKALKGTGGAAKEAQKSLMGFDELNRLNGDNQGGGGGGAGADFSYEKMGLDPDDAVSKFAEMVKRAWQTGDFFDVGHFLAVKAKGWLDTFNRWLTTTGRSYAMRIANSFATLLNGIFSPDTGLAQTLGETFANLGNVILGALNHFLTTTRWDDIGLFLGNAIMSGIMHFNWSQLGETVANLLRAGIMTWRGFLDSDFDFSTLGTRIGEAINGFFNTMGAVDPNTGRTMWQTLGQNISDSAIGLLDMIIAALEEIDWEQVGTAIGEFLGSIDWRTILSKLKTVVVNVLKGLLTAIKAWFKEDAGSALGAGLILAIMGIAGAFGTFIGIIARLLPFIGFLITNLDKVAIVLKALAPAFLPIIQAISSIVLMIGGAIMAIANFVSMWKNGVTVVKTLLMVLGIALVAIGAIILGAPALVTAVIAAIVAAVAWIVLMIKQYGADVVEWLVDKVADLIEWLVNTAIFIGTKISEFLTTAKEVIVTGFTTIVDWITAGCEVFASWWNSFLQGVKDACTFIITAIVTWVQAKIEFAKVMIQTGLNLAKTIIVNIINGIKTFIQSAVSWVQSKIQAGISAVTSAFTTMKSTIVSIWNGLGSALRGVMNSILTGIGSFVNGGIRLVNGLISAFNNIDIDIPDAIVTAVSEVTGWDIPSSVSFNIPTLPEVSVPQLAKGAVLPPNKPFAAIVGDQKKGTNVEAPLETIKLAVAEEMSDVKNAVVAGFEALIRTVEEKDMDVNIGDKEIGQAANRYNKKQAIMRGTV